MTVGKVRTARRFGGMPRWGFNRDYWVQVGDDPFLDRRVLFICPWFGVFLTDILRPDADRDPHDHSRTFASFILSGSYAELVYTDLKHVRARVHKRGSLHLMPLSKAHVITATIQPLRTLVVAGRSRGTWAFWTPQGKVDWKDYG